MKIEAKGRLIYGLFSGPVRQENPALRQDDDSLLSLDAILAQFEGKRILITIEALEPSDADEQRPRFQQYAKFSLNRRRGD